MGAPFGGRGVGRGWGGLRDAADGVSKKSKVFGGCRVHECDADRASRGRGESEELGHGVIEVGCEADGEGADPDHPVDVGQLQSNPQLSQLTIVSPGPTYITVHLSRVLSSEALLLPHLQNAQISGRNHGSAVPRNDDGVLPKSQIS